MDKQNVVHINNKVLSMPLKIWHIYNGILFNHKKRRQSWELHGGLAVRAQSFHCHGPGSIPGWGTKMPQATHVLSDLSTMT